VIQEAETRGIKLARAQPNFAIHFYDPSRGEEEEEGGKRASARLWQLIDKCSLAESTSRQARCRI